MIAAFANTLPLWAKCVIALLVAFSLIRFIGGDWQPNPLVTWKPEEGWRLCYDDQKSINVRLLPSSVMTTLVCILHFKTEQGRRHNLLVLRDAVECEQFRRLRVILRCEG